MSNALFSLASGCIWRGYIDRRIRSRTTSKRFFRHRVALCVMKAARLYAIVFYSAATATTGPSSSSSQGATSTSTTSAAKGDEPNSVLPLALFQPSNSTQVRKHTHTHTHAHTQHCTDDEQVGYLFIFCVVIDLSCFFFFFFFFFVDGSPVCAGALSARVGALLPPPARVPGDNELPSAQSIPHVCFTTHLLCVGVVDAVCVCVSLSFSPSRQGERVRSRARQFGAVRSPHRIQARNDDRR
jgi:hypothetical protein